MDLPFFPTLNASLNALSGTIIFLGWRAIKKGERGKHKKLMLWAVGCSALFLISYLTYHFTSQMVTRYPGTGFLKMVYFAVLLTHTPLAALIVPFVLLSVWHGLKGRFEKHMRITKWLVWVWLYVAATGVVIYLMLYVFTPQAPGAFRFA